LRILHHEGAAAHANFYQKKRVHQRFSSGCDRLLEAPSSCSSLKLHGSPSTPASSARSYSGAESSESKLATFTSIDPEKLVDVRARVIKLCKRLLSLDEKAAAARTHEYLKFMELKAANLDAGLAPS
jgi:hypothetical protein